MSNIISYFNTFLNVLFGPNNLILLRPSQIESILQGLSSSSLENFVVYLLSTPSLLFSLFVWTWFAWFSFHLLIVWPFKWIRSVVSHK